MEHEFFDIVLIPNLSLSFINEIGAAAILYYLNPKLSIISMKNDEAVNFEKTKETIELLKTKPSRIIMIGNYWDQCLEKLLKYYHDTEFIVFCPGIPSNMNGNNLKLVTPCGSELTNEINTGYSKFALDLAIADGISLNFIKLFVANFPDTIQFIEKKLSVSENNNDYLFLNGIIYRMGKLNTTLFNVFLSLFNDNTESSLVKEGEIHNFVLVKTMEEKVNMNSKECCLKSGEKIAITTGLGSITLIHQYLHLKYPESKLTMVINTLFENDTTDKIIYSIVSYDPKLSALTTARQITPHAKGNEQFADAIIDQEFKLPF